jgi:arylsulfatase A-like enzyme
LIGHPADERPVGWQDVMPTLLDLAGIAVPPSVEGLSMVGDRRRGFFYGEIDEGPLATRMIHDGRYKLIYYAAGNVCQLFDLANDPAEIRDLRSSAEHSSILARLTQQLISQRYGGDEAWVQTGELVGLPNRSFTPGPHRGLSSQRSSHWPPPPKTGMGQIEWYPEQKRQ